MVSDLEAPKGGHFCAELHVVTGEVEHSAPDSKFSNFGEVAENVKKFIEGYQT